MSMQTGLALYREILHTRCDPTGYLIFADWLDERGGPGDDQRSALIRQGIDLERNGVDLHFQIEPYSDEFIKHITLERKVAKMMNENLSVQGYTMSWGLPSSLTYSIEGFQWITHLIDMYPIRYMFLSNIKPAFSIDNEYWSFKNYRSGDETMENFNVLSMDLFSQLKPVSCSKTLLKHALYHSREDALKDLSRVLMIRYCGGRQGFDIAGAFHNYMGIK